MEVPIYKADIFVDETDTDRMMHWESIHIYSWRGSPAMSCKLMENMQLSLQISCNKIFDKIIHNSLSGEIIYWFVQNIVPLHLMPFNGTNPYSVVVLDNAVIFHTNGIKPMMLAFWYCFLQKIACVGYQTHGMCLCIIMSVQLIVCMHQGFRIYLQFVYVHWLG
jgi:hypothetical protein